MGTSMAHTYTRILTHMVFATKERRPLIVPRLKAELHAYMAGISRNLGCHVYALGGVVEHCHLVFDLSPTIALANFANKVKVQRKPPAASCRGLILSGRSAPKHYYASLVDNGRDDSARRGPGPNTDRKSTTQ